MTHCVQNQKMKKYHKLSCQSRNCNDCGTGKLRLMSKKKDDSSASCITRGKYEYRDTVRRKLVLLKKSSKPKEVFQYLKQQLETSPRHQFRSIWQTKQQQTYL